MPGIPITPAQPVLVGHLDGCPPGPQVLTWRLLVAGRPVLAALCRGCGMRTYAVDRSRPSAVHTRQPATPAA